VSASGVAWISGLGLFMMIDSDQEGGQHERDDSVLLLCKMVKGKWYEHLSAGDQVLIDGRLKWRATLDTQGQKQASSSSWPGR
jgi:hypothetical protein